MGIKKQARSAAVSTLKDLLEDQGDDLDRIYKHYRSSMRTVERAALHNKKENWNKLSKAMGFLASMEYIEFRLNSTARRETKKNVTIPVMELHYGLPKRPNPMAKALMEAYTLERDRIASAKAEKKLRRLGKKAHKKAAAA